MWWRVSGRLRCMLEAVGISITRSPLAHSTQRLRLLRSSQVTTVLDVGASVGDYGQELRWAGYHGRIISYEPMAKAFATLARRAAGDPSWTCRPIALGSVAGSGALHIARDQVSSSLLIQMNHVVTAAPWSQHDHDETVVMSSLDDEREEWGQDERFFLKLDVQGFEREVLEGATQVLANVVGIEMEMSLTTLYEGQRLFCDDVAVLSDLGFDLISVDNVFVDRDSQRLLQVDGLFVRRHVVTGEEETQGES